MSAVDANPRRQLMWACPRRRLHAVAALPSYMHNRTRACESGVVRGRQAHGGRSRLHRSFSSRLETTSQAMHSGLSRHAIDRNAMPTTFQIISIRVSASQISESMCSERFLMREGLTVQITSSSQASEAARKPVDGAQTVGPPASTTIVRMHTRHWAAGSRSRCTAAG